MTDQVQHPSSDTRNRSKRTGIGIVLAMLILVATAAFLLLVWPGYGWFLEELGLADDAQSAGADSGVNLSEVADNPDAMFGQTVTVSGGILEIIGPNAVVIGSDTLLVGEQVLVVSSQDLQEMIEQSDKELADSALQVTGEVRQLSIPTIEQDLNIELDEDALSDFETVFVAESVEVNPPGLGPGDTERQGPSAGFEVDTSISDIVDSTEEYLGQTVTLSGEVEQIISPHAFRFGDAMLLAVTAEPRNDLFVEPTAYVTGTIREFKLADIERDLNIDLDDQQFTNAEGAPVIVVEALELVK